jgi:hypothetical protein
VTAKRWLWLLLGFCAIRIAVHLSGTNAQAGEQARRQGSLVAYFGGPEATVVEILGQDSALVARLEVASGYTVRIEQPLESGDTPVHGVEIREFAGDVSILIRAPDSAPGPRGSASSRQPQVTSAPALRVTVNDAIVRVPP